MYLARYLVIEPSGRVGLATNKLTVAMARLDEERTPYGARVEDTASAPREIVAQKS